MIDMFSKKYLVLLSFSFLVYFQSMSTSAETLIVKSNQTHTVPAGLTRLDVEILKLEDNATLILPAGVKDFFIQAADVTVGDNVSIKSHAMVEPGLVQHVKNGRSYPQSAEDCQSPLDGTDGQPGVSGTNAPNITLNWTLSDFGSLTIDVRGVNGVTGGKGGDGQSADQNERCPIMSGGSAGQGGRGGDGGAGGNVTIHYRSSANPQLSVFAQQATTIFNDGGLGAAGGAPGLPGKGSQGRYIKKKTLTGNRSWKTGGDKGRAGQTGITGDSGRSGQIYFQQASLVSSKAATPIRSDIPPSSLPNNNLPLEQRISELERQVMDLLKRVQSLEK